MTGSEFINVSQQLQEIEEEEERDRKHKEALEMVNGLKEVYPDIPPTILYTAVLDFLYHPEKTEPDYEKDPELKKEIDEMKSKADGISGIVQGIEVIE